jgi:hypothetical protein
MPIQQFFSYIMGIRPSKKMFWFSDNGFQKKGKDTELCKSIFVGDFPDITEVGENNNPFVNFDLM